MNRASLSTIISASIEKVFEVLADFEKYPEFLPEILEATVLTVTPHKITASLVMNIIKKIECVFEFDLKKNPAELSWTMTKGSLIKQNNGFWRLKKLSPKKTEVTYTVEMDLGPFVPQSIVTRLIEKNLPATLKNFKKRIEGMKD